MILIILITSNGLCEDCSNVEYAIIINGETSISVSHLFFFFSFSLFPFLFFFFYKSFLLYLSVTIFYIFFFLYLLYPFSFFYYSSIPKHKNIQVVNRPNECGDFGAWDDFFNKTHSSILKKYKRIMFVNDTVKGPFIDPNYLLLIPKV